MSTFDAKVLAQAAFSAELQALRRDRKSRSPSSVVRRLRSLAKERT